LTRDDSEGEHSVVVFYPDETYEYVRRWIDLETAVNVAAMYSRGVGAQTGIVRKIIITDGGDNTNFVWEFGKGITYPEGFEGYK
jgi:hypothetical protein